MEYNRLYKVFINYIEKIKTLIFFRKDMISAGTKFSSMIIGPNGNILVCGTEQGKSLVKEIRNSEFGKIFTLSNYKLTSLCCVNSLYKLGGVIGGTDHGQIKVIR